jgi:hypothetical protein
MTGYRELVLMKWVRCQVTDPEGFSRGQRDWARLGRVPGFLGQGGGWSRRTPGVAHVFGRWADRSSYDAFMAGTHDHLASAQLGTYDAIAVSLVERRLEIGAGFSAGFATSSLVRFERCQVPVSRQPRFLRAPGAAGDAPEPGVDRAYLGVFAQPGETDLLIVSLWRTAAGPTRTLGERFSCQRPGSGSQDDAEGVTSDLIDLEPDWTVSAH